MNKLIATARKVDDHSNIKFKSLFIDMDLAMHDQISTSNSPRVRRLRKSLDSHEDFEFIMSHKFMDDDSLDQAMEVSSADKLFFKGQILPLQGQADPKPQFSQPMACSSLKADYCEKGNSFQSLHTLNQSWRRYLEATSDQNPGEKHDSDKDCFTFCHDFDISTPPLQCYPSQGDKFHSPHSIMYANEEGTSGAEYTLRDGIGNIMRSCSRLDGTIGPDSCSSSFRSHHSSSYWSSAEKESRDSSGSSRCSIGSHHDGSACVQTSIEKKAPQSMSVQPKASNPGVHQSELCDIMGDLSSSANPSHRPSHPKPPISSSLLSSRKWTWKGLFTYSLRKAFKLRVDDGRGDVERKGIASKEEKTPVFTFKELPGTVLGEDAIRYRRSVGYDREWQANTYQFMSREGLMKKGSQHAKGSWGITALRMRDDCEDQQLGTIYCLRGGGRQEAAAISNIDGGAGELMISKRDQTGKVQDNIVCNAKESWNKCLIKMKKGSKKLSVSAACKLAPNKELVESKINGASRIMKEDDKMDIHRLMKAKSVSSTPLAKSPVRIRAEYAGSNNVGGLNDSSVGLYAMQGAGAGAAGIIIDGAASSITSAMKKSCNKKVGFAASCPASMRSSPHHSGLLAVVNKATPDLHTAIQGAIAHCKQSQVAVAAPATTPPP